MDVDICCDASDINSSNQHIVSHLSLASLFVGCCLSAAAWPRTTVNNLWYLVNGDGEWGINYVVINHIPRYYL